MDALKTLFLLALTVFCIFRIADIDMKRTFWAESLGYVLTGVMAFWKMVIHGQIAFSSLHEELPDAFPTVMLYVGLSLILWTTTCHRLRRRESDSRPLRLASSQEMDEDRRVA